MSTLFTSVPSKRLSVSITASATTAVLSDILGWDGASLTASDFGTVGYGVFRNSTNTVMEFFEWDPSTITVGATTGITLSKRGLKFTGDLTTQVTANKLTWVRGDTIIELGSNPSQIYQYLKDYIDGIAVAGSPDASTTAEGLVEEATQAEVDAGTAAGGTAARLFVNPSTIRAGNYNDYVADTGVADAYAIAPSPAITAYAAGQVFTFKATNANTGASTVNVNSLGVKSIKKNVSAALTGGEILASAIVTIVYDGTNFQLFTPTAFTTPVVRTYLNADSPATWSKPTGLKYVVVEVQAAGGAGGPSGTGGSDPGISGGGGAGGYSCKTISVGSLGATETVTIGAPGASSSFGSHCSATSGSTGGGTAGYNGGAGGVGSSGDINAAGQGGGCGSTNATGALHVAGTGGASYFGSGGLGHAGSAGNGSAGGNYGGGGGGALGSSGSGGAGGPAIVIVTEYYN